MLVKQLLHYRKCWKKWNIFILVMTLLYFVVTDQLLESFWNDFEKTFHWRFLFIWSVNFGYLRGNFPEHKMKTNRIHKGKALRSDTHPRDPFQQWTHIVTLFLSLVPGTYVPKKKSSNYYGIHCSFLGGKQTVHFHLKNLDFQSLNHMNIFIYNLIIKAIVTGFL